MSIDASKRDPKKTCNTEGCNAWATKKSDRTRCSTCGGESTGPKTKEGKQQSRMNGMKHGLRSDPENLLEELRQNNEQAFAWVQDKFESYLSHAPFGRDSAYADQLLQVCVREYAIWKASSIQINDGILTQEKKVAGEAIIQVDVENPASKSLDRMERTVVKRLEKLDVMPSDANESQAAKELGEIARQALE